jgi:hypothetical protein
VDGKLIEAWAEHMCGFKPKTSQPHVPAGLLALMALAAALLPACLNPPQGVYEFALVGDAPYGADRVPLFEALIDHVNERPQLEWVIHVGDIKQAGEPCTDQLLRSRFDLFQRFAFPFVYTPGDNDWFDCPGGSGTVPDEYGRLDFLRSLFFADPARTTGRRSMPVRTQASEPGFEKFVENVLWLRGPAVYATVHLIAVTREPTDAAAEEHRVDAAIEWIRTAFAVARESSSAAVFIATQADPWMVRGLPEVTRLLCEACLDPQPGLERIYPVLVDESRSFAGPVVLAVGDTHIFRVDKPLYAPDGLLVENFTRVETFGEPHVHWVRVTVDRADPQVFSFHQELVPANTAPVPGH